MAKSHGSKRGHSSSSHSTTTRSVLRPSLSSTVLQSPSLAAPILEEIVGLPLEEVQDRRRYDPDPARPAKKVSGYPARFRALHRAPLQAIGFEDPKRVLICIRRKSRRQVLHALKLTRKGAGGRKHRNSYSNVRC